MTAVRSPSSRRRTSLEWTVRAAWLLAFLAAALSLVGVLVAAGAAIGPLTSEPLTVSIATAEPLHAVGQNTYGGTPYVADDATITATRITAQVSDLAVATRVGLAFGPLAWALTGAGVACSLAFAFARLLRTRAAPRRAARSIVIAALVTAIGTSAGQILDGIAQTGLQHVMWHGPTGVNALGSGGDFTFQLGWLFIAIGGVAIAAVIARQEGDASPTASEWRSPPSAG
ncbi:hypothetical protein [Amnibacterium endophyticum]|uniref:DUF2975 domain-containing protein n=1 Tax=Amnibacterium endophyticum TaxID=2109337 RepID=A0ABW4LFS2_9MICO